MKSLTVGPHVRCPWVIVTKVGLDHFFTCENCCGKECVRGGIGQGHRFLETHKLCNVAIPLELWLERAEKEEA